MEIKQGNKYKITYIDNDYKIVRFGIFKRIFYNSVTEHYYFAFDTLEDNMNLTLVVDNTVSLKEI